MKTNVSDPAEARVSLECSKAAPLVELGARDKHNLNTKLAIQSTTTTQRTL